MNMMIFMTAVAISTAAVPASAQPVATPSAQTTAVLAPTTRANILRAGTPIALKTREALSTKEKAVRVGQRVRLEVAENVMLGNRIVIPLGTPAVGEVTDVRNKGMWGKSGYIKVSLLHLMLGDRVVRISGTFDDKGSTGTGGVVASVVLLPVAGFFTTGTSANIPLGSPVTGALEENIEIVN